MGCSSSVQPLTVQPNVTKYYNEASTQTDETQTKDASVNTVVENEKVQNDQPTLNNATIPIPQNSKIYSGADQINATNETLNNQLNFSYNHRLSATPNNQEIQWILKNFDASQFCSALQQEFFSIGPMAIKEAVDAMRKVEELQALNAIVWQLLERAVTSDDVSYFIRAYTAESDFYKILNRELAKQEVNSLEGLNPEQQLQMMLGNVFQQFNQAVSSVQAIQRGQQIPVQNRNESNWAKLFLRPLYRMLATPNSSIRYQGTTYRGMWISFEELEYYTDNTQFICNKAITSTSKLRPVAQDFIDSVPNPPVGMLAAMFIYNVESLAAMFALDISQYSLIPDEQEVLLLPGMIFLIHNVRHIPPNSVEIELRSTVEDLTNMMSSSLSSLFSLFS